ncbi:DUF3310 domain-containing protein [Epibacterium sp. MM17-32]|uniref:DUF3310 domain-containing protein n=1 Tax=Epibacterium sp. MM17-32 TaxID=2917734 RepID=UPI001EF7070B|nr:DUF3310 domain-containing protein [Epibacterium sp. MM17-32]MCG7628382.1 DUF3310 domain-containing protein [Epibacterium sp. MM17-32]
MDTSNLKTIAFEDLLVGDIITWGAKKTAHPVTRLLKHDVEVGAGTDIKTGKPRGVADTLDPSMDTFYLIERAGMVPMTVRQLRDAGGLTLGNTYLCVDDNDGKSVIFTKGERYDTTCSGLMTDNGGSVDFASTSRFVLANDDQTGTEVPEPAEVEEEEEDIVANPAHYARFEIQPLEFAMRNRLEGHVWNIVKYTCRAGHKLYPGMTSEESEIKDLQKGIDIAQKRIRMIKGEPLFV